MNLQQELINAPEPEPVARVTGYYAGHTTIITLDGRVLPAGTALYAAPPHQSEHHLEMVNTPAPTPAEPPADLDAPEFSDGCEKEGFPGGCARMGCCKQLPATADLVQDSVASEPVGYLYTNLQSGEYHVSDADDDYRGPERVLWCIEPVYRRAKGQS